MRPTILAILTLSVTGCATLVSEDGICTATEGMRKSHASALLKDGGPLSQDTGERLLTGIKAGCQE